MRYIMLLSFVFFTLSGCNQEDSPKKDWTNSEFSVPERAIYAVPIHRSLKLIKGPKETVSTESTGETFRTNASVYEVQDDTSFDELIISYKTFGSFFLEHVDDDEHIFAREVDPEDKKNGYRIKIKDENEYIDDDRITVFLLEQQRVVE